MSLLCSNTKDNAIYLIGAYFEYEKPENFNIYLQSLINDLTELIKENYFYVNDVIKIRLFDLICDVSAKS